MLSPPVVEPLHRLGGVGRRVRGLYGLKLASGFPFASNLAAGEGSPDLAFDCVSRPPVPGGWEQEEPAYASKPYPGGGGESEVLLYRLDGCLILRFTDIADFYLWTDRILCHPLAGKYRRRLSGYPARTVRRYHRTMVEIYFLGLVMACWLEWRGIPALHASAVVVGDRAAAFLSGGGGGKSSCAVALMRSGCPLLTDDILPVEHRADAYLGRPGYPQMRLWPEQARRFLGSCEGLDLVHPALSKRRVPVEEDGLGGFCETPRSLACLYLPERRNPEDWGTGIEIKEVPRREAVMTLIGRSFAPEVVGALGLQPGRLGFFARMSLQVPVRRVLYPSGFDHLPRVGEAIREDLSGPGRSS